MRRGWRHGREADDLLVDAGREDPRLVPRNGQREDIRLVRAEAPKQSAVLPVVEAHVASGVASDDRQVREQRDRPDERRFAPAFGLEHVARERLPRRHVPHAHRAVRRRARQV